MSERITTQRDIKFRAWHIEDKFMFPVKSIAWKRQYGNTAKFRE